MSENNHEQAMLNPQIADVEVGIRKLRKITVYPLSMADQLKLTELITRSVTEQMAVGNGDIALVAFAIQLLKDNLGKVLSMATDEDGEALLSEMSNLQAAQIAELIYETNFGIITKNYQSLVGKLKTLFPSARPLPPYASDMGATD